MRSQGISYMPLIWTAWGRPHDDVVQTMRSLIARAARRRGLVSFADVLREAKFKIALEIQARAARMVIACGAPTKRPALSAQCHRRQVSLACKGVACSPRSCRRLVHDAEVHLRPLGGSFNKTCGWCSAELPAACARRRGPPEIARPSLN